MAFSSYGELREVPPVWEDLSQLKYAKPKQKTTRYASGKKVIQLHHLSDYNGVVQATIRKGKVISMAKKYNSLAHTAWMCKYHIVFIPKYRRKVIYNQYRRDLIEIIKALCKYKEVEIIEGI